MSQIYQKEIHRHLGREKNSKHFFTKRSLSNIIQQQQGKQTLITIKN
jgi:hypothetical protein